MSVICVFYTDLNSLDWTIECKRVSVLLFNHYVVEQNGLVTHPTVTFSFVICDVRFGSNWFIKKSYPYGVFPVFLSNFDKLKLSKTRNGLKFIK